jgi:hypothetical protein
MHNSTFDRIFGTTDSDSSGSSDFVGRPQNSFRRVFSELRLLEQRLLDHESRLRSNTLDIEVWLEPLHSAPRIIHEL